MVKMLRSTRRASPTLDDVARKAGVSTATVSRCLNTPDRVVERTRLRVMDAVQALEYTPNFGAKVMAAQRTHTIGAVIPTMENAIFARGLQAFQDALHMQGYTLLVASSSYDAQVEKEQVRVLASRGADGLLLIGHDRDAETLRYLEARNIPALVAWAHDPTAILPSIGFDNFAAMQSLAEMVLGLGHRKIGMISAHTKTNDRARARVVAVQQSMAKQGLDPAQLTVIETEYGVDTGAAAFQSLMDLPTPPTVILCGNDVLAVGALRRAHRLGIVVPDDVSITGFDDIELARVVTPELTTVHVPHREMGKKAAEMLIDMVEGRDLVPVPALAAKIELRGSLTAVKEM